MPAQALLEFFQVWDMLEGIQLQPGLPDHHCWTLSSSGINSSKSPYDRFFLRAVQFEPAERIWRTWAPPRCRFFLWLASLNHCWTADWLTRHGLDHPARCLMCDQDEETMQHIQVTCVFSREIWFQVLSLVGLQQYTPQASDGNFHERWQAAEFLVPSQYCPGFNSLVVLVVWCLWKLRHECVFEDASPCTPRIIEDIKDEARIWCMAGAKGLSSIWPG
jgi:hypothetical protein